MLHDGSVPGVDPAGWRFAVTGLVDAPFRPTLDALRAMPAQHTVCDIHGVPPWSRLATRFTGVAVQALLRRARPAAEAAFVMIRAEPGFTTTLSLASFDRPEPLLAWAHDGAPLTAGARRAGAARGAAPRRRDERAVGDRDRAAAERRAGLLGADRVPHARRPVGRGAAPAVGVRPVDAHSIRNDSKRR